MKEGCEGGMVSEEERALEREERGNYLSSVSVCLCCLKEFVSLKSAAIRRILHHCHMATNRDKINLRY